MKDLAKTQQTDYGIQEFLMNFNSKHTKRAYQKDIENFFNFLSSKGRWLKSPKCLKLADFIAYRDHLLLDKATNTVARKIGSLKSLMAWFENNGHIDHNPCASLKIPRAEVETPTLAFSDDEVRKMLAAPDVSDLTGSTHKMALCLLFYFGLRRSELVNLRLSDIYADGDVLVLRVKGKGGKLREIPFSPSAELSLRKYLESYEKFRGIEMKVDAHLLGGNDLPVHTNTIYNIIKQYSDKIGVSKKVSPHSCRATAITKTIEEGASITEVADMAGHSNIVTTQGYWKKRKSLKDSPVYKLNY